jgi:hypothetical protein
LSLHPPSLLSTVLTDVDMQQSSPIHKASLVEASLHSPALLELLDIELSRPVFGKFIATSVPHPHANCLPDYVVDCVVDTVDYAMGRPSTSARGRSASRSPRHIEFTKFVTNVLTRAEVTVPVVLAALVYVDRAKPHLHIALEEWACERVFLGAVMLASKVNILPPFSTTCDAYILPLLVSE